MTHGASFFSIDKYGLDALIVSAEKDPKKCAWAWNITHWNTYLFYIKTISDTLGGTPCVIWQMTVGHLNSSKSISPYTGNLYPDLPNTAGKGEDPATTFFFGDVFSPPREHYNHWIENKWNDPLFSTDGTNITYGSHLQLLKNYGIVNYMVGGGVGISTNTNFSPVTGTVSNDDYFLISKIQDSYK
jgi:hypothetical protein